jgi:ABC-type multidrug transport system fused ATPase/permease subunit
MLAKPLAKISKKTLETSGEIAKTLGDIFAGGIIIRVFRLQERLMTVFGRDNDELRRLVYREARIDSVQALISGITQILTTAGVFVAGSLLISSGDLSFAQLMTIFPLCGALALSFSEIGGAWAGMQAPLEAGQRLYTLLDGNNRVEEAPIDSPLQSTPPSHIEPSLEITNLTFKYADAEKPVFENVDLSVAPGQLAVIHGESGSGKSTLLKVIGGLYESEGGEISIGGTPLSHNDIKAWRSCFAYVDQSCTLFNLTIAENIGLGRDSATFDEIKAAAVEADADGFIAALPNGYDTQVGEAGSSLSGGQRQRIAIARALLRKLL